MRWRGIVLVAATCLFALLGAQSAQGASFVVTNASDSGPGSLRQAILDANATPGPDTISFAIPGAGTHTISLLSPLPFVSDPAVIDATSQPGYAGAPLLELDGSAAGGNAHGIYITGTLSVGNLIQGNFIGTDRTGHAAIGNAPSHGVTIDGASNNTIGGATPGARNVISGNGFFGISIVRGFFSGAPASGNLVQGNYIGTDVDGTAALGNHAQGIAIINTPGNTVGGTTALGRNVVSGNRGDGVFIWQSGASGNLVEGNFIGTDASGTAPLGNASGVNVTNAANNMTGGTALGARNVISANGFGGAFNP